MKKVVRDPGSQRNTGLCVSWECARDYAILILWLAPTLAVLDPPLLSQRNASADAQTHAERGLQFAQEGDLNSAEKELRNASELAPNDAEILSSFGTVLAMQKKFDESTVILQRAVKLSPGDITTRRYLAANLWQLRRFPEARANLEVLLKQKPDDRAARLLLGMVAENTRDYSTAVRMLSSVPDQVRQQPESVAALARSYYHLGQTQNARNTLAQLSGIEPVLLGAEIADQMHDYQTAERMLQSLQTQSPRDANLAYRLASVQYHAGKFAASHQALVAAVNDDHPTWQIYNLLGWCYYRLNQPKEAVEALNQAMALAPQEEANYVDLTTMLVAMNSLPAALAAARKGSDALPQSGKLFELRGSIELKAGQFTDAVKSYEEARRLDPNSGGAVAGLGEAQFSAGLLKQAVATFESGLKEFSKDPQIRLSYGTALLKQAEGGNNEAARKAEEMFRTALSVAPDSAAAHYQLGKITLEKGNVLGAIPHLEQAVKLSPNSKEAHFSLARAYRRAARNQDSAREMDIYQKLTTSPPNSVSPVPHSIAEQSSH